MRAYLKWGGPAALLICIVVPVWDLALPWPPAAEALSGTGPRLLVGYSLAADMQARTYLVTGRGSGPLRISVERRDLRPVMVSTRPAGLSDFAFFALGLLTNLAIAWWFWLRPQPTQTSA